MGKTFSHDTPVDECNVSFYNGIYYAWNNTKLYLPVQEMKFNHV